MDNRPIGIFDSGVGGLSALRRLTEMAPGESFVYFGDTARAPYGDRPTEEIKLFSRRNARFLRSRDVKALIIACNTSTASAIEELTADNGDIPVSGTVEPTAMEAARVSVGGRIGVIATAGTVESGIYEKTILQYRPDARIISQSCPKLVPLIESGHTTSEDGALAAALEEYLAPLMAAEVDTVVLGCTHYPLIAEAIRQVMGRDVPMVDSGGACTEAVLQKLAATDALAGENARRREQFYCSARREDFTAVAKTFLGRDIASLTQEIDVEGF